MYHRHAHTLTLTQVFVINTYLCARNNNLAKSFDFVFRCSHRNAALCLKYKQQQQQQQQRGANNNKDFVNMQRNKKFA